MDWDVLKEINKGLFRFKPERASLPSFIGALGALLGVLASFSKGFDVAVSYVAGRLVSDQRTREELLAAISKEHHGWAKLLTALGLLLVFYVLLFTYHTFLAALRKTRKIEALEQDKQHLEQDNQRLLTSSADYQAGLATAVGLKVHQSLHSYDILNFNGDARMTRVESFSVTGLKLHHLVRRSSSTSATGREAEKVKVDGLPAGVSYDKTYEQKGELKLFNIYFTPALERTLDPVTLTTEEQIQRAFFMDREAIPRTGWSLEEPLELVAHTIRDCTDLAELLVTLPLGYRVTERSFFRVRYDETNTPHAQEEKRLADTKDTFKREPSKDDGRERLRLSVRNPVVGLSYVLCWQPPTRSDFQALQRNQTATRGLGP